MIDALRSARVVRIYTVSSSTNRSRPSTSSTPIRWARKVLEICAVSRRPE